MTTHLAQMPRWRHALLWAAIAFVFGSAAIWCWLVTRA